MKVQKRIETKIRNSLDPAHLEVINESHMHHVPPGSESHFRLVIVSEEFNGKPLLDRHRRVNRILAKELQEVIHALALQTMTPEEWAGKSGGVAASPPCLGGDRSNRKGN